MILVTGAGGFIGRHLADVLGPRARAVSHAEIDRADLLDGIATVVHCGRDPHLGRDGWSVENDAEIRLAERVAERPGIRFVSLGTRKVYAPSPAPLRESDPIGPADAYGRAKLDLEDALVSRLGERLTRTRIANVFGVETGGRRSFMGAMLTGLASRGTITFDMAPVTARDFVPVDLVAEALARIASAPPSGIINLGSGIALACGDLAAWTMEGFGGGRLVVTDPTERDGFVLDVARMQARTGLVCTPAMLRDAAIKAGRAARS